MPLEGSRLDNELAASEAAREIEFRPGASDIPVNGNWYKAGRNDCHVESPCTRRIGSDRLDSQVRERVSTCTVPRVPRA